MCVVTGPQGPARRAVLPDSPGEHDGAGLEFLSKVAQESQAILLGELVLADGRHASLVSNLAVHCFLSVVAAWCSWQLDPPDQRLENAACSTSMH